MTEEQNSDKQRLDWHSGFEGGLMLSLRKYAKELEVEREHPLSSEPLRIDFIVIKKNSDVVIDNSIGRGYKKYNLIEYKSPDDELSVDVLWKVIGYACLYKSMGDKVDAIKADEITVSIFRSRKPTKLFDYLKQRDDKSVEKDDNGIYRITGLISIPITIVVIRELVDYDLKALSIMMQNADEEIVKGFLEEARSYTESGDRRFADAVLQISVRINKELFQRLRGENKMCEALRELMADDLKEAEDKGQKRGEKIGEKIGMERRDTDKISELLGLGRKPEDIAEFCNYPLQQVLDVQKNLANSAKA